MIPTASERDAMLQTGLYRGMENFSDAWLKRHAARVADYSREWCADPFHAWSRGWSIRGPSSSSVARVCITVGHCACWTPAAGQRSFHFFCVNFTPRG